MSRKSLVFAAMLLQVLFLVAMAGDREWIVRTGKVITLRTAPIDPQDPMRGDYLRLSYEISRVAARDCRDGLARALKKNEYDPSKRDLKVYATLNFDAGGLAEIATLSDQRPKDGLFLRGRVQSLETDSVNVRWGVEALFMEQGKSKIVEEDERAKYAGAPLLIDVAVSGSGTAVIKGQHWSALGMILSFEHSPVLGAKVVAGRPAPTVITAVNVELKNLSSDTIAIIDLPQQQSFRLIRASMGGSPDRTGLNWVNLDKSRPSPSADDVRILPPGQSFKTRIDLHDPKWFFANHSNTEDTAPPLSLDKIDERGWSSFRVEYAPTPVTSDLRAGAKLQLSPLRSSAFNPRARVD